MANSKKIRVMISSRCNDFFPSDSKSPSDRLSQIRKMIKNDLETLQIFGRQIFEVWINEDAASQPGSQDSWDVCLQAVRDCDILLVLYNGNAGWAKEDIGSIGICHAELMEGLNNAPSKVRLIQLNPVSQSSKPKNVRDKTFQDYINKQNLFRGQSVTNANELFERVHETIAEAIVTLTRTGAQDFSKGRAHFGSALEWTRLNFRERQQKMIQALCAAMAEKSKSMPKDNNLFLEIAGTNILWMLSAIPAALSVVAAKELVGQPFLRDFALAKFLKEDKSNAGPVHIIACHKSATEAQAIRLLGFPDAVVVNGPFGIFVADNIQKVQFAFLTNCRDETSTRHTVQRFFEWLYQTDEAQLVVSRAKSRTKIIQAIAEAQ